jgi:hypothetical protein
MIILTILIKLESLFLWDRLYLKFSHFIWDRLLRFINIEESMYIKKKFTLTVELHLFF